MNPEDFFIDAPRHDWDLVGEDPWNSYEKTLDKEMLNEIRANKRNGSDDIDVAYALTRLTHRELEAFGTDKTQRLNDEDIAILIRCLRTVLSRCKIKLDIPFQDFRGFHGYWSANDMSGAGGWGARRGYLSELFSPIFKELDRLQDERIARASLRGVDGEAKNIIFASTGPKPRIVLRDAVNNIIEIVENAEFCLVYDREIGEGPLLWSELADWWRDKQKIEVDKLEASRLLYARMAKSLASDAEGLLFKTYYEHFTSNASLPALLPQVYLHYDPYTKKERLGSPSELSRERMDFLLILPNRVRVVIEVDGKHHYADSDGLASPRRYSEMVEEDRRLRLRGYEVYRFGGYELLNNHGVEKVKDFFSNLLRYNQ